MEAGGGCREQNGCVKTGKRKRLGWRQVCRDVYDEPKNRAGRQDDAPAPRKVFFVTVSKNEGEKTTEGGRGRLNGTDARAKRR